MKESNRTELTLINLKEDTMKEDTTKLVRTVIGEVLVFFIDGWFTKLLWNHLLVSLLQYRVDPITYWQSLGLAILTGILFKVRNVKVTNPS